ncbi:Protein ALP1-like [Merluccius polli]|uniref:Protein ALP1-like n=1 Tax=Merluccius polli TaxID=89951 RepID=A0AA47NUJ7_MERPO|nr:Protein ALP1-like [Merluccius polli]
MARNRRLALALALAEAEEEEDRVPARLWVHDITRGRQQQGAYHNLVQELRFDDARFAAYFRPFEQLLRIVAPSITKLDTKFRQAISPEERLCICLRYLATGDSFRSVAFGFRVGASTVAGIVHEVCAAIWTSLLADYMPRPDAAEWRKIAAEFSHLAFPNCLGAMDGKHVVIEAPPSSGSLYYNYKGTFSIVLLAVVDAKYRFRVVDIGAYGRNSDGGTLSASAFGTALRQNTLGIPADSPLPGAEHLGPMPHVFLADEAFPLRRNIMRPYPGHNTGEKNVFNFRLSHVRRMVECAFGILASQWRVYRRVLFVSPEVAENIVKATCMLHNFLRWDGNTGLPGGASTEPSLGLQSAPRFGTNNATRDAVAVREKFAAYFMSPAGRVHWQDR